MSAYNEIEVGDYVTIGDNDLTWEVEWIGHLHNDNNPLTARIKSGQSGFRRHIAYERLRLYQKSDGSPFLVPNERIVKNIATLLVETSAHYTVEDGVLVHITPTDPPIRRMVEIKLFDIPPKGEPA